MLRPGFRHPVGIHDLRLSPRRPLLTLSSTRALSCSTTCQGSHCPQCQILGPQRTQFPPPVRLPCRSSSGPALGRGVLTLGSLSSPPSKGTCEGSGEAGQQLSPPTRLQPLIEALVQPATAVPAVQMGKPRPQSQQAYLAGTDNSEAAIIIPPRWGCCEAYAGCLIAHPATPGHRSCHGPVWSPSC